MSGPFDPIRRTSGAGHALQKSVWTDADFAAMGWHDCRILALALVADDEDESAARLLIDLDYIVRWVDGGTPGAAFSFWIAPATLIFHGVYHLEGSISGGEADGFEVDGISRKPVDDRLGYDQWAIEADLALRFRAAGYRQIIRREPLHVPGQRLSCDRRGGISFSERSYDDES